MLFVTTYKLKAHLSRDDVKALMGVFAEHGPGPGTSAHYVAVDGSGGVLIAETDDVGAAYRSVLNYTEWIDYDTKVVLPIEDAVPHIADSLA